jgi:membrane fusion protein, adhesin transport system
MLNISKDDIMARVEENNFKTLIKVEGRSSRKTFIRFLYVISIISIVLLFLPWTQNIRTNGSVTTLKPDQRPQTINSIIPGRIERWYVKEGDFVKKGDTIAFLSEVKDKFFDTSLISRTQNQMDLKNSTVDSYKNKVLALNSQKRAIEELRGLKIQQGNNKLLQAKLKAENDSNNYQAAQANYAAAKSQFNRMDSLYQEGLKSLTDLENRRVKEQKAYAYRVESLNKWLTSQNEIINTRVELSNIRMKFDSDIAKINSEIFSTLSTQFDSEGTVTKMMNDLSNFSKRNSLYYILAPQNGYISSLIYTGIGETIKEGDPIVHIMPTQYQLSVELFVEPIDLPLLQIGQEVRIQFDGWPAVVFAGWPNTSYGTYGGTIYAMDMFIGQNGKYRILVKPDESEHEWPDALMYGGGTNNMILLNDVPIWYELWRNVNGFPPDFYKNHNSMKGIKK